MATWNYRIVQHADHFALHEVHYDGDQPTSMSAKPITFVADLDEGGQGIVDALERAIRDAQTHDVFVPPESWS